jgi:TolB-like protein/Tfp pilus assembly protein PilF
VFRVAGAYIVVGWVLSEVASVMEAGIGLPEWFDGFVIATLALGFPIAVLLAWAFELTPEGVKPTPALSPDAAPARPRAADYVTMVGLAVVAVLVAVDVWPSSNDGVTRRTAGSGLPSIAVMPFVNMSDDPANAYFADGISEEILNALARFDGLKVVARTSSFALRGADITVPEIGERLEADLVLEGSVRTQGMRVRVTAQLIETVDGRHVWAEVYERQLDDLFGVQDDVTNQIASTLPGLIGIEPLGAPDTAGRRPVDPEAYRLYLQARYAYAQRSNAAQRGAVDLAFAHGEEADRLVKEALELDPELAGAWNLLGNLVRVGVTRAYQEQFANFEEALQAASVYYERALELDPDAIEVLVGEAQITSRYDWQWEEATDLYERAVQADPESAAAHTDYAYHLSKIGRCQEAIGHARLGAQLDPVYTWRRLAEPRILACLGRVDEALAIFEELMRQQGTNGFYMRDMFLMSWVRQDAASIRRLQELILQAEWPEGDSIQAARRDKYLTLAERGVEAIEGDPSRLIAFADSVVNEHDARVAAGEDTDLRLDELWWWSMLYAWSGETQKALHLYVRALEAEVLYISHTYRFALYEFPEPMRSDPRYLEPWETRPELAELARLRLEALRAGEMAGILPDGTVVQPEISPGER